MYIIYIAYIIYIIYITLLDPIGPYWTLLDPIWTLLIGSEGSPNWGYFFLGARKGDWFRWKILPPPPSRAYVCSIEEMIISCDRFSA